MSDELMTIEDIAEMHASTYKAPRRMNRNIRYGAAI